MPRRKKVGRKPIYSKEESKKRDLQRIDSWKRSHTKSFNLTVNTETEKDIIEQLLKQPNKQAYIKGLIRKDIGK